MSSSNTASSPDELEVEPNAGGASPEASITLRIGPKQLTLQFPVPTAPTPPGDFLPMARQLAEVVVQIGVESAVSAGRRVSCRSGCGACCRQLVPITLIEARRLREVVEAMPEPRRSKVLGRFADAQARLADAGLLEPLRRPGRRAPGASQTFGMDYFRLGVACPFLEAESCSIYEERPLRCREFLVTSPAENCRAPSPETIDVVELPAEVSRALARIGEGGEIMRTTGQVPVLPLVLALEWAAGNPVAPPPRPASELLNEFFGEIAGRELAAPSADESA